MSSTPEDRNGFRGDDEPAAGTERSSGDERSPGSPGIFTVPNALGAVRLLASPGLVVLAAAGRDTAFLLLFLALTFTDWIDGKLAKWLDQRTELGARIDTGADVVMYGALLLGIGLLREPLVRAEWPWIAAGCGAYLVSFGASLVKFGRPPSYHTRLAKTSWLLGLSTVVALFTVEWIWPVRLTAAVVTLTNLEGTLITVKLTERRVDVGSVLELDGRNPASRADA